MIKLDAMGEAVFYRTYSRDGETFEQACDRVVRGTKQLFDKYVYPTHPYLYEDIMEAIDYEMWDNCDSVWDIMLRTLKAGQWSPPGRGWWMMGTPYVEELGLFALANCAYTSSINLPQAVEWAANALMLGSGVGYSTEGGADLRVSKYKGGTVIYYKHTVADDREGWAAAIQTAVRCGYMGWPIEFDYSQIRPKGTPLKRFGGVASGPEPLRVCLDAIRDLFIAKAGGPLGHDGVSDIFNFIGRCVVAGNVRRSAQIGIGPDTQEFLELKDFTKNAEAMQSHRWAANMSVMFKTREQFDKFMHSDRFDYALSNILLSGEPGFCFGFNFDKRFHPNQAYLRKETATGMNPCGEICLDDKGLCILAEVFHREYENPNDFHTGAIMAALYAFTCACLPSHDPETDAIMEKTRRIGVGITNIMGGGVDRLHTESTYASVRRAFRSAPSLRMTTVKPSGTVSTMYGVTPGIHPAHSEFYIRRMRIALSNPILARLTAAGYPAEPSINDPNTWVVSFPTVVPNGPYKKDMSVMDQLRVAKKLQSEWSDNSVSITVTIPDKDKNRESMHEALLFAAEHLKSVSFLPLTDHCYEQAPYEEITEEQYEKMVDDIASTEKGGIVDWEGIRGHEDEKTFCDGGKCAVKGEEI